MQSFNFIKVADLELERHPQGLLFDSGGQSLYVCDWAKIYTWSIPEFRLQRQIVIDEAERGYFRFLRDGKSIMLIRSEDVEEGIHHITLRDLTTNTLTSAADIRLKKYELRCLFNRAEDRLLIQDYSDTWNVFEFPSFRRLWSVKRIDKDFPRGVIYSPDESEIWTTGSPDDEAEHDGEYLSAWDPMTAQLLRRCRLHNEYFYNGLCLSPNSKHLLVVGERELSIVNPSSWEMLRTIPIHSKQDELYLPRLAFLTSDVLAISGWHHSDIYIVDCQRWQVVGLLNAHPSSGVGFLVSSPDGQYLASGSLDDAREVKVWQNAG